MDLNLSEQQEMIKSMAREFLEEECPKSLVREMAKDEEGFPTQLWNKMVNLNWMGLAIPEKYEGSGGSFLDLVVLLQEMGRALVPTPFFPTVVLGASLIMEAGSDEQKRELLPKIARGETILTVAFNEVRNAYEPDISTVRAESDKDGYVISGTKFSVPYARIASTLICTARTKDGTKTEEGITLFLVDAKSPGIKYAPLKTMDGSKEFEVTFDKTRVPVTNVLGKLDEGWKPLSKVLAQAAVAKCAEMVGAGQRVLEMTVEYAKTRVQFGQPIGSFQAIQHHCANILADVDSSRLITYQAAWKLSEGLDYEEDIAIAKAWVSDAYRRITASGHQVHGGVGFMEDHDMGLYYKNARPAEIAFGDAIFYKQKLVEELGLRRIV